MRADDTKWQPPCNHGAFSKHRKPSSGLRHALPALQLWCCLTTQRALERNRTADHILTMDVLYRLSYKGRSITEP